MKKILFSGLFIVASCAISAEKVLEKNGVVLTDEEMLAAASDLSEYELEDMRKNNAMLRTFIEQQFDNKVMNAAITAELKNDTNYEVLRQMNEAKFANYYYIKQKALKKINAVKDFKTLAKQTYYSTIKNYQSPQTYDYYHILFVNQDGVDNQAKAEALLADIKADKITLADAAKKYHSAIAGTDAEGVLKKVQPKQLMEAIQKAVLAMRVGDISEIIETDAGYHIIGLKQVNDIETKPYDADIEQQIIADLKTKMYRTVNKEIRDQYRGPEGLTVNDDLLKSITERILKPKK